MTLQCRGIVLALACLTAVAATGRADIIYQTGSGPPTYAVGQLDGQDGWIAEASPRSGLVSAAQPRPAGAGHRVGDR